MIHKICAYMINDQYVMTQATTVNVERHNSPFGSNPEVENRTPMFYPMD
jgi:hypothetical protein